MSDQMPEDVDRLLTELFGYRRGWVGKINLRDNVVNNKEEKREDRYARISGVAGILFKNGRYTIDYAPEGTEGSEILFTFEDQITRYDKIEGKMITSTGDDVEKDRKLYAHSLLVNGPKKKYEITPTGAYRVRIMGPTTEGDSFSLTRSRYNGKNRYNIIRLEKEIADFVKRNVIM